MRNQHFTTVLAVAILIGPGALVNAAADTSGTGAGIFNGSIDTGARLDGTGKPLPVTASRCVNCHARSLLELAPDDTQGPESPDAPANRVLSRERLTTQLSRRGAPPTVFNEQSFCTLLRDGVDPAYVVIPRIMPRYALNADQCRALWHYLTGPDSASFDGKTPS